MSLPQHQTTNYSKKNQQENVNRRWKNSILIPNFIFIPNFIPYRFFPHEAEQELWEKGHESVVKNRP